MVGVPRVVVFGPNPLLTVTIENEGTRSDELHLHAGGQGVWVARSVARHGGTPVLCGFTGGETGVALEAFLAELPGEHRLVRTAGPTGCYVMDRRQRVRDIVAVRDAPPASRHEVDDLVGVTFAALVGASALVLCNAYPADTIHSSVYGDVAAHANVLGVPVYADLSSPRLDAVLPQRPDVVKLNDWELAEWVHGPVTDDRDAVRAVTSLQDAGAQRVVLTRGAGSSLVLGQDGALSLVRGPALEHGAPEGCGDTMTGALAARLARGDAWVDAVVHAAAAGTVNYLRHGLGTGDPAVVDRVASTFRVEPVVSSRLGLRPSA